MPHDTIDWADQALKVARNHFQWATERRYVDKAIFDLCVAEIRVDAAHKRAKKAAEKSGSLFCPDGLARQTK